MNKKLTLQILKEDFRTGKITKESFITQAMNMHRQLFSYLEITKSTDIHEISIRPEGISFLIGNEKIKIFIPPEEQRVAPLEIMNFGKYEQNETVVIDLLSSEARCIFDIGANIGYHSIRFAKLNPRCFIHAFEPMTKSYSYLKQNIISNNVESQVFAYNIGLSENGGNLDFFIPPTNETNASMANVSGVRNFKKVVKKTFALDFWSLNNNQKPDFIKCDIEGAELLVFRGAMNMLIAHKPLIFSELLRKWSKAYDYHPNDMINFFNKLGYLCYGIGNSKIRLVQNVTEDTVETNYAFLHDEAHFEVINKLKNLKFKV